MTAIAVVVVAVLLQAGPAVAASWSGLVSDGWSSKGLVGARVCAGVPGRTDVACTKTGPDARYVVSYPPKFTAPVYMLYVDPPAGAPYFSQARQRSSPGEAHPPLVGLHCFLKGVVVSAETGQIIVGAEVSLLRPGAVVKTVTTDSGGYFAFGPVPAFDNPRLQYNTYGVPDNELPKINDRPLKDPQYGIRASAKGYGTVATTYNGNIANPHLRVQATATPISWTPITIRLPKPGKPAPSNAIDAPR